MILTITTAPRGIAGQLQNLFAAIRRRVTRQKEDETQ